MANTLITPDWITKESARILVNNLKFTANVTRSYDDQYVQAGARVGYVVKARLPQRFRTTKGQAFQPQAINDQFVPISLTDQANVGLTFSSASMTMEVDLYRERYIKPASEQLANTIDHDGLSRVYKNVYHSVGTPGTTPTANITYLNAGAILDDAAVPMDGRIAMLNSQNHVALVNTNTAVFNPQGARSDAWRSGQFSGENLGISAWYKTQNVARHTTGSFTTATPTVKGADQTGSSLITEAWASGATTLNEGDVFTIANVFAVNPQNYSSTGRLQQFVVTQTISDTSGDITVQISPPIITSGNLQTVTVSPGNGAAIIPLGSTITTGSGAMTATSTTQSLVYHPEAFTCVMADLEMPEGGAIASRLSNNELGVSLRLAKQWNLQTDQNAARLDCLYGWKTVRAELAARVWG